MKVDSKRKFPSPERTLFHYRCDSGGAPFGVAVNHLGVIVYEGVNPRWGRWLGRPWEELKRSVWSWYPTGISDKEWEGR